MVGSEYFLYYFTLKKIVHNQDHLSTENQKWSLTMHEDPDLFSLVVLVRDKMSGQYLWALQFAQDLGKQLVWVQLQQTNLYIN